MTTQLTYLEFLAVFLVPPIVALALLTRRQWRSSFLAGGLVVTVVGVLYTTPWDNALIAREVWWYGDGAVLARLWLAPIEEYLFMVLQPILTLLWLALLRARFDDNGTDAADVADAGTWTQVALEDRFVGAGVALLVGAAGLVMLTVDATFYIGAILAWAAPVLAVQWAFGWPYLRARLRLTVLAIGVPTAYLAAADRIAIELGVWVLSTQYTTGLAVAGLPIEEGAFFLLTNVFVVQGVLLFLWVVDTPTTAETTATARAASRS